MSYCRFSSDNFTCDLYCYQSEDGYTVHVATHKWRVWWRALQWLTARRVPLTHTCTVRENRTWVTALERRLARSVTHLAIGLPFDGKSFYVKTELDMFRHICWLANLGYRVPKPLLHLARKSSDSAEEHSEDHND